MININVSSLIKWKESLEFKLWNDSVEEEWKWRILKRYIDKNGIQHVSFSFLSKTGEQFDTAFKKCNYLIN